MEYREWKRMEEAIDSHYRGFAIEPIVYSAKNKLDPFQHTIIKYVTRCHTKHDSPIEDIDKAIDVLQKYKKYLTTGNL